VIKLDHRRAVNRKQHALGTHPGRQQASSVARHNCPVNSSHAICRLVFSKIAHAYVRCNTCGTNKFGTSVLRYSLAAFTHTWLHTFQVLAKIKNSPSGLL